MIAAGWWWADNDGINVRRRWEKAQRGSLVPAVRAVHGWQAGEEGGAKAARHRVCSPQHRVLGQVVDESHSRIEFDCKLRIPPLTCRPCCGCLVEFSAGELPASCTLSAPSDSWSRPWGCTPPPSTRTSRPSCPAGRAGPCRSTSVLELVCLQCPGLGTTVTIRYFHFKGVWRRINRYVWESEQCSGSVQWPVLEWILVMTWYDDNVRLVADSLISV